MTVLILGLVIFLGVHSLRILAPAWRTRQVARMGEKRWKLVYSVISVIGFVVLVWGFGQARLQPQLVWVPPLMLRHLNSLFTLLAFVLVAASHGPPNHLRSAVGHPMVLGVAVWAFGHLLATGMLHDVVLFGAFLVWSVVDFAACRLLDRRAGVTRATPTMKGTVIAVVAGIVMWAVFAFWLHGWLIGVSPMG